MLKATDPFLPPWETDPGLCHTFLDQGHKSLPELGES